jgi:RNA polymerase sigma-70 factor (ECF subfamily)
LHAEYQSSGRGLLFERFKRGITGDSGQPTYAAAAGELGLSDDATRQAASRLRKRYRELLREEVAQTVAEPADVDDEIRSFFAVLSG